MKWNRVCPVFPVVDVAAAMKWYGRVLGFEVSVVNPPDDTPVYAVLNRDGASFHLRRADEAPHGLHAPVQAQFSVESDLGDLFRQVPSCGVEVVQRPKDQEWGHRDFMIADLDGNVVWVTQRMTE